MRIEKGQALMELAVGMLTLVIVVSVLCGFTVFIVRSLHAQNTTRTGFANGGGKVEVDIRIGNAVIETMSVRENCRMPSTTL